MDACITAPETVQALTEAGIVAPRREIAQYLRSRKHLGLVRNIAFFDFIRAFAAIRYSESIKMIIFKKCFSYQIDFSIIYIVYKVPLILVCSFI